MIVKQSLIEEQITFKPLTLTYKAVHSGCSMSHFFQRHTPICLFFQLLSTCLLLSTRTYYQVQHMSVLTTDDLQKLDDTSTYISRDLFSKKPNSYLTLALYEWLPATHLEMSSVWHCTYTMYVQKVTLINSSWTYVQTSLLNLLFRYKVWSSEAHGHVLDSEIPAYNFKTFLAPDTDDPRNLSLPCPKAYPSQNFMNIHP